MRQPVQPTQWLREIGPFPAACHLLSSRSVIFRRGFLSQLSMWTSLVAAYGTAAAFAGRFLYPAKRRPRLRSIFVGRLDVIADGEARELTDLKGVPIQVVREGETLRALSTVCPHLGCRVRWEPAGQRFFCPCHNGVFDREGKVVSGPPPRSLDRYEVEVTDGSVYLRVKEPEA
jgi:nitrite reductase/ring-hydroxylating ferredoxin subunit